MIRKTVLSVAHDHFDNNLSEMARSLDINRSTLTKYRQDHDGKQHMMIMRDNRWQLYTLVQGQRQ